MWSRHELKDLGRSYGSSNNRFIMMQDLFQVFLFLILIPFFSWFLLLVPCLIPCCRRRRDSIMIMIMCNCICISVHLSICCPPLKPFISCQPLLSLLLFSNILIESVTNTRSNRRYNLKGLKWSLDTWGVWWCRSRNRYSWSGGNQRK